MKSSPTFPVEGYHGTYRENLDSILNTGFRDSIDHNMWYGDGCYFFVEGLNDPKAAALQFAKDEEFKQKTGKECCVIRAIINVNNDNFLDMTTTEGISFFNSYREEIIKRFASKGKKIFQHIQDHDIMKNLRTNLEIEFVRGHVNIKFGEIRKFSRYHSNIPNVTIFVVTNASKNIERTSITCI